MADRDESNTPLRGADQWFQSGGHLFVWKARRLLVYRLKHGQPAGAAIVALSPGVAESFREWLCELVDVSQ